MEPVSGTARDGRRYVIRAVRRDDAAALHELEQAITAAGEGVVQLPEELPPTAEEFGAQQFGYLDPDDHARGVRLLCESDDAERRPLASSSISRFRPRLCRHGALLGIGVRPDAQGVGIGRALLLRTIAWATEGPGRTDPAVIRIELYVRADNARARRLYESVGFEHEGVRRRLVRLPDGRFVDDVVMGLLV
jgi:putative acetyltransferase